MIGSVITGAADLRGPGAAVSTMTSPSALSDSKNWFVFVDLPNCMPEALGAPDVAERAVW